MKRDELMVKLGEIDTNVKTLLARDHTIEKRVSKLEKRQWLHSGGVAVLAAIFAKIGLPFPITLSGH